MATTCIGCKFGHQVTPLPDVTIALRCIAMIFFRSGMTNPRSPLQKILKMHPFWWIQASLNYEPESHQQSLHKFGRTSTPIDQTPGLEIWFPLSVEGNPTYYFKTVIFIYLRRTKTNARNVCFVSYFGLIGPKQKALVAQKWWPCALKVVSPIIGSRGGR